METEFVLSEKTNKKKQAKSKVTIRTEGDDWRRLVMEMERIPLMDGKN